MQAKSGGWQSGSGQDNSSWPNLRGAKSTRSLLMSVLCVAFRINPSLVQPCINVVASVPNLSPNLQIGWSLPLISPLFHRPVVDAYDPRRDLGA